MSLGKKVTDYLLLRAPSGARMAAKKKKGAAPGKISGARIAFSFIGIILGIILSFFITGLAAGSTGKPATQPPADVTSRPASPTASPETPKPSIEPKVSDDLSWRRFLKVGLISLVICGLSYQGLYNSLRLYQNEPAWLILIIAFQYGYFWQSIVKVVAS